MTKAQHGEERIVFSINCAETIVYTYKKKKNLVFWGRDAKYENSIEQDKRFNKVNPRFDVYIQEEELTQFV